MVEAALYILTGLTLYGGSHHLYLGVNRASADPHVRLGALYLLLAAFAFASALTFQPPNLDTLLPAGKLAIGLGIVLWASLLWHIALRCGYKPLLLLDALTAVWAIFLVRNFTSPNSLLYADVTPVRQTLLSGETVGLLFSRISPWWIAVEVAMLVSLLFCFYACYRLYRRGQHTLALVNITGLVLLGLITLFDHLVSVQLIQAGYLAPFGFLLYLLPSSLYPLLRDWRRKHAPEPAPVYNLSYMPEQASFHTDVSQLHTPLGDKAVKKPLDVAAPRESGRGTTTTSIKPVSVESAPHKAPSAEAGSVATLEVSESPQRQEKKNTGTDGANRPLSPLDTETLHVVSDNLIDIAVFATMALNRFKRGDADPQTLEALCKKVRSQAIKTRRLANQLGSAQQGDDK